jgi:hypothetical protein
MDSLMAVLLAPSSSQTPTSLESVGGEASKFAEDEGAEHGFNVVYHTVSSFLSSKKGWTGLVRKFGEKSVIRRLIDDCLDQYSFSRGRVSCR